MFEGVIWQHKMAEDVEISAEFMKKSPAEREFVLTL